MGFRYDMQGKSPQSQAIVRQRDKEDKRREEESKKKKEKQMEEKYSNTKYAQVHKRVTVNMDKNGVAAIELITVKEFDREELRFAYYIRDEQDELQFVPRPLDATKEVIMELLEKAKKEEII